MLTALHVRLPALLPALLRGAICACLLPAGAVMAGERWALVVGNANYADASVGSLANTINDARTMAASFTNMGFDVYLVEDATRADLEATVARIAAEQDDASLGVFFFAGHGLQEGSVNYALPADIDPSIPDFLSEQSISINGLIGDLSATGIEQLVVILDACRNSPFEEDQAFGVGLALVDAPANTIIAYSTAPGAVALDGIGANSPFTAALASVLEGPQQDMRDVLRLVRAKVRLATGGVQTPWYIDNSRLEMTIQPRDKVVLTAEQQVALSGSVTLPTTAWRTIEVSSDPNDFELFATLYPDHQLSSVALEQVVQLRSTGQPPLPQMDLGVPSPNPEVPGGIGGLITECDVLATGPGDIFGLVEPVPHDLVNTRAALRACVEGVTNDPENARLTNLLARVLFLEARYEESLFYYERAAELGNSTAYGGLADIYRYGLGTPKDEARAASYAREGALAGNAPLRLLLSIYYKQGWGVPQSFNESRRWLELAALSGYASAQTALGDIHRRGEGVAKNPQEALRHYEMAALQGKTDAMNNIGMAYMRGEGVEADTVRGIQWLSRASEQGNPYSAFHLGRAFRTGWGVEPDPRQAIAFFRVSAQRNFLGAYIQIGDMLTGDEGLPADLAAAYANYAIAIEAAKVRNRISDNELLDEAQQKLDVLIPRMTADELRAGQETARDWIEQYGLLDFNLVSQ